MTPTPVLPSLPERTPTNYALEFAEYMAIGAGRLLDAINAEDVALERLGDPAERMTNEHVDEEAETARANRCELATGLRSDIYEFRKRRDRAIESLSRAPAEPVEPSDPDDCDAWCPRCEGSGEETEMDSAGPDAREVTIHCKHCEGHGTLLAAYHGLVRSLEIEHKARMHALAKLYVQPAHPTESAGPAPAEIAAERERWRAKIEAADKAMQEAGAALAGCARRPEDAAQPLRELADARMALRSVPCRAGREP